MWQRIENRVLLWQAALGFLLMGFAGAAAMLYLVASR